MNDEQASVWQHDRLTLKTGADLREALTSGASVNERRYSRDMSYGGESGLHVALTNNDLDTMKDLLSYGADVEAKTFHGHTPFNYARSGEAIDLLREHGAGINTRNEDGLTALQFALWDEKRPAIIEALIRNGADVNEPHVYDGNTPLMMSAERLPSSIARCLIEHGADVNAKHIHSGKTPLHFAAVMDRPDIVQLLLEHGADWSAETCTGRRPIDAADKGGECHQLLKSAQSKQELLKGLGAAWKPGDCKTDEGAEKQEERQTRQRKM